MGVLDVLLGRNAQGHASKINLALVALMLWRWYQGRSGGADQDTAPSEQSARRRAPAQMPSPQQSGGEGDKDFGPLADPIDRMPGRARGRRGGSWDDEEEMDHGPMRGRRGRPPMDHDEDLPEDMDGEPWRRGRRGPPPTDEEIEEDRPRRSRRRRPMDEDMEEMDEGPHGGGGLGGGLGDILGEILRGGGRGGAGGGSGGLGDILGDILGGGRGGSRSRLAGAPDDALSNVLQDAGAGGLGALLAGGSGGGVLGDLIRQFERSGHGDAAHSWVSRGENIPVTPEAVEQTFGSEVIDQLADRFQMDRQELLRGLSEAMPETVDKLTPEGRLPTEQDIANWK